jgi:RNA polymerase sigma-70 factor (ECF subfamily)
MSSTRPNENQPADDLLVRRAQAGDDQAFAQLVVRHTPALFRLARRMTSDSSEAEALVQETFLRLWKNLARYKGERPFYPYLVTIALNLGRDQWRKFRQLDFSGLESLEESQPDASPSPEMQVERSEARRALAQAVADLPDAYRVVIALRYEAGLSYQEIAESLELPINTVRTHLRRAKAHLRKILSGISRLQKPQEDTHG